MLFRSYIKCHRRYSSWRIYYLIKTYFTEWNPYIMRHIVYVECVLDLTMILYFTVRTATCIQPIYFLLNIATARCVLAWTTTETKLALWQLPVQPMMKIPSKSNTPFDKSNGQFFQTQNSKWCPHPIRTILVNVWNACKRTFPTQNILTYQPCMHWGLKATGVFFKIMFQHHR